MSRPSRPCCIREALREGQFTHFAGKDLLPISFWRDAKWLLPGQRDRGGQSGESMCSQSQLLFIERYIAEATASWDQMLAMSAQQ